MSEIAIIDAQIAGISGDMLLSALIDAGAERKMVTDVMYSCAEFFDGYNITSIDFVKAKSSGISCTKLKFNYKEKNHVVVGSDFYRKASRCCDSLNLDSRSKSFVLNSLKTLIQAESVVHGTDFTQVRLHESASLDTIADLVGTSVALNNLDLFNSKIYCTSVAVGKGILQFSHGVVPNPGNAILEIFRGTGFTLTPGYLDGELTTPTGAAMLVNLMPLCISVYPTFVPSKVGYGGGTKEYEGIPNVVRVTMGRHPTGSISKLDSIYELETNIDDLDGETIGNVMETLYLRGASDVTILQGITKKNRPVNIIKVLSDKNHLETITNTLFSETGTLGVRLRETTRLAMERSIFVMPISIKHELFYVHVKISKNARSDINSAKPEYEDVKAMSVKLKIPYKNCREIVQRKMMDRLSIGEF
jgi:pyridinium-3,5-bisthiocarboxylic acid mononucleotide nickel chelatase